MSITPEQWHDHFLKPLIDVAAGNEVPDEIESGLAGFTLDAIYVTKEIDGELATDSEIVEMILRLIETADLAELRLGGRPFRVDAPKD